MGGDTATVLPWFCEVLVIFHVQPYYSEPFRDDLIPRFLKQILATDSCTSKRHGEGCQIPSHNSALL